MIKPCNRISLVCYLYFYIILKSIIVVAKSLTADCISTTIVMAITTVIIKFKYVFLISQVNFINIFIMTNESY